MVVFLAKLLQERPALCASPSLNLRTFGGDADIAIWLAIRNQAFADQIAGTRPWTDGDFRREFLDKPEWRPDWMWFAESLDENLPRPVGAVAMTLETRIQASAVSVSWLAVLPAWRRQGVGGRLMATLEAAAWDAGRRLVLVETRSDWAATMQFYQSLGYGGDAERKTG